MSEMTPRIESAIAKVVVALEDIIGCDWSREQAEAMREALRDLVAATRQPR